MLRGLEGEHTKETLCVTERLTEEDKESFNTAKILIIYSMTPTYHTHLHVAYLNKQGLNEI